MVHRGSALFHTFFYIYVLFLDFRLTVLCTYGSEISFFLYIFVSQGIMHLNEKIWCI